MSASLGPDCYHCDLPIPKGLDLSLSVLEKKRHFCCMGCYSVAETIVGNGMTDYYKFRTQAAITPDAELPQDLFIFDDADVQADLLTTQNVQTKSVQLISEAIRCSACAWLIEKKLRQLEGIRSVQVNVTQQTLTLEWQPTKIKLSKIFKSLYQLGYPAEPFKQETLIELRNKQQKSWLRRLGLAGLGMMQVMMYAVALYIGVLDDMSAAHRSFLRWVSFLVATPVLLYAGYPFYISAFKILKQFKLNMDVPITLALILAYFSSIVATLKQTGEVYFDSVTMFIFFLLIGRYLEFRARQKISQRVYATHSKLVLYVDIFTDHDNSAEKLQTKPLAIQKVKVGDLILIKAGATLALDGELVSGEPDLNESMLNGEFMPVAKQPGDKLYAGSINNNQPFTMRVTQPLNKGYWSQLLALQEKALLNKPKIALLADKIARYFVFFVLILATATYAYWALKSPSEALWISISVLVVTCPCALSLATPIALTCGVNALNKRNFLISKQDFLPQLNKVTDIIFDKTGTLTRGLLTIKEYQQLNKEEKATSLAIIAALEEQSEHPIAKVFSPYKQANVCSESLNYAPFAGVSGFIDGTEYFFGNSHYIASCFNQLTANHESAIKLKQNGLYLANKQELICYIELSDSVRTDAREACQLLAQNGYKLHLLSGDPSEQVENLAKQLNINSWANAMSPQEKLDFIKKLQNPSDKDNKKSVLMVGDGLNDAPAMSQSNASIAMAAAADLTKMSADSYLLSEKLTDISQAISKALLIEQKIKQNLAWALTYNLVMIPFAASGLIAPYLAAIGMSLSSIVVVLNSLKLNSSRPS